MVLPASKKRVFKQLFRPGRSRIYKPGGNDSAKQVERNRRRRQQAATGHQPRVSRPGSKSPVSVKLNTVRALREIKYYQASATAEMFLIPQLSFQRLVREIQQGPALVKALNSNVHCSFRWERDALVALQMMSEHILVLYFEMTYPSGFFHC